MAVKTVWDGKFIQFMDSVLAQTEMLAGRVQIWMGTQGYVPGWQMADSQAFPLPADPPPVLSSINPATAVQATGTHPIVLTGTGFVASDQVLFDGAPVAHTFVNATTINATIPASAVPVVIQVAVRDSFGRVSANRAFTYTAT